MNEKYAVRFDIDDHHYYAIWYTDDKDGFVTENGSIVYFTEIDDLFHYAESRRILINEGITYFNATQILHNIETITDCDTVLDFWNIISDISASLRIKFTGDDKTYNTEYAKLVSGCNLNSLEHDYYIPNFTTEEEDNIKKIIIEGYNILCKVFCP